MNIFPGGRISKLKTTGNLARLWGDLNWGPFAGPIQNGGVLEVRTPPPFGGPSNFIKREKRRMHAQMHHILVDNSYPDPPLSEILYPPLILHALLASLR